VGEAGVVSEPSGGVVCGVEREGWQGARPAVTVKVMHKPGADAVPP